MHLPFPPTHSPSYRLHFMHPHACNKDIDIITYVILLYSSTTLCNYAVDHHRLDHKKYLKCNY